MSIGNKNLIQRNGGKMTKGMLNNEEIEYAVKPKPITVRQLWKYSCCDNCASAGDFKAYEIRFNKTDFSTPKGNIGKKRYAKVDVVWLCEDCFNEMKQAMNNIKDE